MYQTQQYSSKQIDYYGAITEMDDVMGKLCKLLEELGIKKNTMLWFSSDNGPCKGTMGVTNCLCGLKHSLYEGGVCIPGMIEWPDIITSNYNEVSSFPVVSSDLLRTVCDILDITLPDNHPINGISILPFLQGRLEHRNQSIYWTFSIPWNFNKGTYNISTSGDQ